jgi:pimeloyl-ACP methyl ester carboxylesterase
MVATEGHLTAQDGTQLYYQKLGDDPASLIIPNAVHMFDTLLPLASGRGVIFFDLRNRGRSESVADSSKLARGIHHDVEDIEAVRRHFGIERIDLIGHSYVGLTILLYALQYPEQVGRLVPIGPVQPFAHTQYPIHLTNADANLAEFLANMAQLQKDSFTRDPKETGRMFWDFIRHLMVADPRNADKIQWKPYEHPNELNFMKHWSENVSPSIQALALTSQEWARVQAPVLVIHGTKDRQAPYGGGREWGLILPNARLLTVPNVAHVPWIEDPDFVFGAIETFLGGTWPSAAEKVKRLEPIGG